MSTPKWHRKLNRKLIQHIKETTASGTLREVKNNIHYQHNNSFGVVLDCALCDDIARLLKLNAP